ncbi:MAG: hypothetical protein IIC53_14935 [Proteobacteria bacterium]|nr:hypothetical protein [Pseudomonadota bacterium]
MRRILAVFLLTCVAMLLIFDAAQWYADNSALPRYCGNPAGTVEHVREILSGAAPLGGESKRPYVVAAKLIFLVPRQDAEPLQAYLARLQRRISEACRVSY